MHMCLIWYCMQYDIIAWKAQEVPLWNNTASPKHQEEEENSSNRNLSEQKPYHYS